MNQENNKKVWIDIKALWKSFVDDPKKIFKTLIGLSIFIFLVILGFVANIAWTNYQNNKKLDDILRIDASKYEEYGINGFAQDFKSTEDLLSYLGEQNKEKSRLTQNFSKLQRPYSGFLQNIYLPSVNIWYNPYTKKYDLNIFGDKYLSANPFVDTNLLKRWGDFFKGAGEGLPVNEITDIKVLDVKQAGNGLFKIGIKVGFKSPQRRSFLVLIDKLSMTSNKKNIALINDFTYSLWQAIKQNNKTAFAKMKEEQIDNKIGEEFYNWIFGTGQNNLLTGGVIEKAISISANCKVQGTSECYYAFREKFRNLPSIAYNIGINSNSKKDRLKQFYTELTPLLNITSFVFNKSEQKILGQVGSQYVGEIGIDVYGRDISESEIGNIQGLLGKECLGENNKITTDSALTAISAKISMIGSAGSQGFDSDKTRDLGTLKAIITDISKEYAGLKNYEKIVKVFEIYRMLKDNNICITKN